MNREAAAVGIKREAAAVWEGGLKDGRGTLTTQTGVLSNTPYSFTGRFESGTGTNPEELIAAAEAGCFTMALSGRLGEAGMKPQSIRTRATLTLEKGGAGWAVSNIHLRVEARVPGADRAAFQKLAADTGAGCIVSRLLRTGITVEATLEA